MDSSLTHI